jgi:hypothetical protein
LNSRPSVPQSEAFQSRALDYFFPYSLISTSTFSASPTPFPTASRGDILCKRPTPSAPPLPNSDAQLPAMLSGAAARQLLHGLPPARPLPRGLAAGVAFVADGSGDARTISPSLARLTAEAGVPLQVEAVAWSLGYRRVVADHVSHANHLAQGRLLAGRVAAYRQACPGRKVYLVGYSPGCAVVLAPVVCAAHDLRPTLRAYVLPLLARD